jgi:hypothetical protein
MVGGRRRNPRARQGADVKIGPAARNSFSRMLGSWFGIAGSRRIRGWQGAHPVDSRSSPETNTLRLTWRPSYEGFGRRPLAGRWCAMWGRRSKASQGGNRGQERALFGGARSMEIWRPRADGMRRGAGFWRAVLLKGTTKTSRFGCEDMRIWGRRGARSGSSDGMRSAVSYSGARLEAEAIDVARRDERRRS